MADSDLFLVQIEKNIKDYTEIGCFCDCRSTFIPN